MIPYGKHHITQDDIDSVVDILKSNALTQGPNILEFEKAFARYVGSKYAIAVSNGTAALHLCALALNVKPGDKVITTSITFVASANCVKYCGGEIIFADIVPSTYLLDIDNVREILSSDKSGDIKGIIPVNLAGRCVDLEAFRALADEFGCWIIEDSCHSPGGHFLDKKGNRVLSGNGSFADLSIFSFHPVKHIAAGEGGMVTTDDENLYKQILNLRTHGIQQDHSKKTQNDGPWYYEMQNLGFNYRLTNIQAALGISQLSRADAGLLRRREIADIYYQAFKGADFVRGQSGVVNGHAYHLYILEVEDRLGLYNYLREFDILAQIHYVPAHLMPYYRDFGWKEGDLPHAEKYYKHCISLPIFPTLKDEDQTFVIKKINEYYSR